MFKIQTFHSVLCVKKIKGIKTGKTANDYSWGC